MPQEPTFDELRAAIVPALQNARFRCSFPSPTRAEASLSREQMVKLARELAKPSLVHLMDRVQVDVPAKAAARLELLLRQSSTLDEYFDDDKRYIHLIGAFGMSVSTAIPIAGAFAKIVKSALLHSTDAAAETLADFLKTGTFPVRTLHFVKGPRVTDPIDLDAKCRLVPYSTVVELAGRAITEIPGHRIPLDSGVSGCGLVITSALRPGTDAALRPGAVERRARMEYEGIARFGPDFICAMLGVVTRRALYPFCHVEMMDDVCSDTLPMISSRGGYSANNVEFSIFPTEDHLTDVDRDELVSLVTAFAAASDEVRRRMMIPLARLRMAMTRREYADRCIDLCVALEALVGDGRKKEFSERVAWIYSQKSGDYQDTKRKMKTFRGHRGRIVHAQPFDERPEMVEEAMSILIECIKWIVRNRRIPDWKAEQI